MKLWQAVLCVLAGVLACAAVVIAVNSTDDESTPESRDAAAEQEQTEETTSSTRFPEDTPNVEAIVDNRVTSGDVMVEDRYAAYLSTEPWTYCKDRDCAVPNTDLRSGDRVRLFCQTTPADSERVTNGNDSETADDDNPELYESELYYWARHSNGGEGLISEVWLRADFRGGLGLQQC